MSHDSVFYLNGAKSLLEGKGYPHTHFPPLYSVAIASVAFVTGKDVISSASALSVWVYGLNLFLAGFLIWRLKASIFGSLGIVVVFAMLPGMVRIHLEAMSEPIFFSLILISLTIMVEYFKKGSLIWVLLSGLIAGLSALTRYIGIFFIVAAASAVVLKNKNPVKKKIAHGFLTALSGGFPVAIWLVSNLFSKGSLANRMLIYHPKDPQFFLTGWDDFKELIGTQFITKWTLRLPGSVFIGCFYLAFALILISIGINIKKSRIDSVNIKLLFFCCIALILYLLTLWFSVTFIDDSTTLTARILSPILVLMVISVWVLFWPVEHKQRGHAYQILPLSVVFLLMFLNLPGYLTVTREFRKDGILFTGRAWSNSTTLAWINQLPESIAIYSNESIPLGFFARHSAYSMPEKMNVSTGLTNPSFEKSNEKMLHQIQDGKAVLVIFTKNEYSEIYQPKEILTENLERCLIFEDSEVYSGRKFLQDYCGNENADSAG